MPLNSRDTTCDTTGRLPTIPFSALQNRFDIDLLNQGTDLWRKPVEQENRAAAAPAADDDDSLFIAESLLTSLKSKYLKTNKQKKPLLPHEEGLLNSLRVWRIKLSSHAYLFI